MSTQGSGRAPRPQRFTRPPRWLLEALLVLGLYAGYETTRGFQRGAVHVAIGNGWAILHWERARDLAPEHLLTHALIDVTPLAVAAAYFYATMHYLITGIVLIWLYRTYPVQYRTARTAIVIGTLLGLWIFHLVPTAPPRLLPGAGVPDALFAVRHWGWWGGEGSVPRGLGSITNQFAAMPSLHVGWALWCGFLLYRFSSRRWVRACGVAYPVVTTLVVLATGNHYLLDAVAGAAVMGAGAVGALALRRLGTALAARRTARLDTVRPGRRAQPRPRPGPDAVQGWPERERLHAAEPSHPLPR